MTGTFRRPDPPADGDSVRHRVRVGYIDTDQGGIVHHSSYVRWLEAARTEFLRSRGLEYRKMESEAEIGLPVADMHIRFRGPARFDDVLEVECWVGKLGRALLRFDYRIWREGKTIAEAQSTLACVTMPDMRVRSLPEHMREALR